MGWGYLAPSTHLRENNKRRGQLRKVGWGPSATLGICLDSRAATSPASSSSSSTCVVKKRRSTFDYGLEDPTEREPDARRIELPSFFACHPPPAHALRPARREATDGNPFTSTSRQSNYPSSGHEASKVVDAGRVLEESELEIKDEHRPFAMSSVWEIAEWNAGVGAMVGSTKGPSSSETCFLLISLRKNMLSSSSSAMRQQRRAPLSLMHLLANTFTLSIF